MTYALLFCCLVSSYFLHEAIRAGFAPEFRADLERLREQRRRRRAARREIN